MRLHVAEDVARVKAELMADLFQHCTDVLQPRIRSELTDDIHSGSILYCTTHAEFSIAVKSFKRLKML
jgi:hypothetical protein